MHFPWMKWRTLYKNLGTEKFPNHFGYKAQTSFWILDSISLIQMRVFQIEGLSSICLNMALENYIEIFLDKK